MFSSPKMSSSDHSPSYIKSVLLQLGRPRDGKGHTPVSQSCSLTVLSSKYIVFDRKSIPLTRISTNTASFSISQFRRTYRCLICVVKRIVHLTPGQYDTQLQRWSRTHKTRNQTRLSNALFAEEYELELLEWVVGRRVITRRRCVWTRHFAF